MLAVVEYSKSISYGGALFVLRYAVLKWKTTAITTKL